MISMEPVLKRGYSSWDRAVLPEDEFALRADGVRAALERARLNALVVVNYSLLGVMVDYADIAYLAGLQSGGALLVPRSGEAVFVSFGGGRELAFMRSLTPLTLVPGSGKAFEVLRAELEARGVPKGRIAAAGVAGLAASVAGRVRDALGGYSPVETFRRLDGEVAGCDLVNRASYVDLRTYLVDDILVDRKSTRLNSSH